jgi:hypothetical protein
LRVAGLNSGQRLEVKTGSSEFKRVQAGSGGF